ncbi:MAG: CHAD domain-containing protein [Polyangiaceae bacterium]|nr:CHAD domain-containing protein [Polyangiaceae bacterium]
MTSPPTLTIAAVLVPALRGLSHELEEVTPRLSTDDPEAIHDLRVTLRRLRSLLRPARRIFGRFHADFVRAELGRVAEQTGALRDEEALHETLARVAVTPRLRALTARLGRARAAGARARRRVFLRAVEGGELLEARRTLDALLHLPIDPRRDRDGRKFAARAVARAVAEVERLGLPVDGDVAGLHELRIAHKRVRYLVMGLAPLLGDAAEPLRRQAERAQKRLGDVHDLDVAGAVIARSRCLDATERSSLGAAITRARAVALARFHDARLATTEVSP